MFFVCTQYSTNFAKKSMDSGRQKNSTYKSGLFYALAAYTAWGIFPLYWKMLKSVPAEQILAHRILWSLIFLAIILFILKNRTFISYLRTPRILLTLMLTGALVGGNWGVYIYAINHNHIVDASLGYYMNPLVNISLGVIFIKERLSRLQILAVVFALAGVIWLTFQLGRLPWISIFLAFSFALYGLFRKKANLDSMSGLLVETLLLSPIALIYLVFVNHQGIGAFGHQSALANFLLILGGPITAIPLLWFGKAATRIPLSTLGFIQYLSPSIQLLIGILIFQEPFNHTYFISFLLVWAGLTLFTINLVHEYRKNSRLLKQRLSA
jgi:chloramphenicol-sensitive protein RarD